MKKLILFILIGIVISCKPNNPNEPKPIESTSATQDLAKDLCDEYTAFEEMVDEQEQLDWIKAHEVDLCNGKLDACIIQNHELLEEKYTTYVTNYWKGKTPVYKTYTWEVIKDKIKDVTCYEKYLVFGHSNGVINKMDLDTTFDTDGMHFSIPLFRGVDLYCGNLQLKDEFLFTIGKDNSGKEVVLFKVKNASLKTHYFDIATDPSFIEIIQLFKIAINDEY